MLQFPARLTTQKSEMKEIGSSARIYTVAEFSLEDSCMEKVESHEVGGQSVAVEPHMLGGGRHRIGANLQELPEGVTR